MKMTPMVQEESEEMDDWFADTVQHSTEPIESTFDSINDRANPKEQSISKWVWVASAAVVAGGHGLQHKRRHRTLCPHR